MHVPGFRLVMAQDADVARQFAPQFSQPERRRDFLDGRSLLLVSAQDSVPLQPLQRVMRVGTAGVEHPAEFLLGRNPLVDAQLPFRQIVQDILINFLLPVIHPVFPFAVMFKYF